MRRIRITAFAILTIAFAAPVSAMSNNSDAGLKACLAWCIAHNKTADSRYECYANCYGYYKKHPKKIELMSVPPGSGSPGPAKGLVRGYKGPLNGTGDGPPILVRKNCVELKNCK